jgi:hypothetical protein
MDQFNSIFRDIEVAFGYDINRAQWELYITGIDRDNIRRQIVLRAEVVDLPPSNYEYERGISFSGRNGGEEFLRQLGEQLVLKGFVQPADAGVKGKLEATEKHLEDMRTVAMHQLKIKGNYEQSA